MTWDQGKARLNACAMSQAGTCTEGFWKGSNGVQAILSTCCDLAQLTKQGRAKCLRMYVDLERDSAGVPAGYEAARVQDATAETDAICRSGSVEGCLCCSTGGRVSGQRWLLPESGPVSFRLERWKWCAPRSLGLSARLYGVKAAKSGGMSLHRFFYVLLRQNGVS